MTEHLVFVRDDVMVRTYYIGAESESEAVTKVLEGELRLKELASVEEVRVIRVDEMPLASGWKPEWLKELEAE